MALVSTSAFDARRTRKRERDIFEHRQMRPDRVGLEHHADIAVVRFDRQLRRAVEHRLSVDLDPAFLRRFQAGDAAQRGGLAAAGGAEQGDQLAVGDLEADMVDDGLVAEALDQSFDGDARAHAANRVLFRIPNFSGARIMATISATVMTVVTIDRALATPQLAFSKNAQIEIDSTSVLEV